MKIKAKDVPVCPLSPPSGRVFFFDAPFQKMVVGEEAPRPEYMNYL